MPKSAPLIAHIINAPNFGGPQLMVLKLIQSSALSDFRHCVIVARGYGADHREMIGLYQAAGAQVLALRMPATQWLPSYRAQRAVRRTVERLSYWQWKRLFSRITPAIVNTHTPYAIRGLVQAARQQNAALVYTAQGAVTMREIPSVRAALAVTSRFPASIFAVSEATRDDLCSKTHLDSARCGVIYNGIDLKAYRSHSRDSIWRVRHNIPADSVVFGTVGRISGEKGHVMWAEAAERLIKSTSPPIDAHFVVAGDGPDAGRLRATIATLGLGSRFHMLGFQSDVPYLLKQFDAFVLPSYTEGLPNALVEAAASGLACVATNVGGVREVLDETSGIIVEPTVEGLYEGMVRALDANLRSRMGQTAQQHSKRFDIDAVAHQYAAVYRGLLHMDSSMKVPV